MVLCRTKRYGDQVALTDIALTVRAGEILGLIGPNGAGKTTLLEALAGVLPADSADLLWCGESLPPARRRDVIFYLPDGMRPYHDQPVARVLAFFAGVYRRSTAHLAGVVAAVGLAPVLAKRVHALSKGYSRRLMLAAGLLTPQPLLLMDEPFDGFDLRQTREIMGVLRRCAAEGRTLVRHAPLWPLLAKKLWEVLSGRALWTMLLLLCPLIGYSFVQAVSLYSEASAAALQSPVLARGLSPLDGVLVPAFGAWYVGITLLFPFVAIRVLSHEKESGALRLLVQLPYRSSTLVVPCRRSACAGTDDGTAGRDCASGPGRSQVC